MNRRNALLAAMTLGAASLARANYLYLVSDKGIWPESWPKELESLRKQARTYEGPKQLFRTYLIPFTKREEFEAAWPDLLKVKTKGAPVILVRAPKTDFFAIKPAGVLIHTPPVDYKVDERSEERDTTTPRDRWLYANYIELAVDGEIVDLNRIELPKDTPIFDERFKVEAKK